MHWLFLGSPGPLATAALAALLEVGARPAAILIDSPAPPPAHPAFPVAAHGTLAHLATLAGIRTLWLDGAPAAVLSDLVAGFSPDLLVVACLGRILDPGLLSLPRGGCVNVHPSSLPAHRGPAPMFWQLRRGLRVGGVTLHYMARRPDAGAILGQSPVPLPGGIGEREAEAAAARVGGRLLGRWLSSGRLPQATPQRVELATYQANPRPADFTLAPSWPVERAFRFMRGARWRGMPFRLCLDGRMWQLDDVLEAHPGARAAMPAAGSPDQIWLPFSDGLLLARGRLSKASCGNDPQG